jgi:hypothetical protein
MRRSRVRFLSPAPVQAKASKRKCSEAFCFCGRRCLSEPPITVFSTFPMPLRLQAHRNISDLAVGASKNDADNEDTAKAGLHKSEDPPPSLPQNCGAVLAVHQILARLPQPTLAPHQKPLARQLAQAQCSQQTPGLCARAQYYLGCQSAKYRPEILRI